MLFENATALLPGIVHGVVVHITTLAPLISSKFVSLTLNFA